MLSNGQLEVRKIINSFLEEYENLQEKNATDDLNHLYRRVIETFCSNEIIKNDLVTSQPLETSRYSKNYLQWLYENGVKDPVSGEDLPMIDFPMREILYDRDSNLKPAYMGGAKWWSTISCLFGLAQGKRLNPIASGL